MRVLFLVIIATGSIALPSCSTEAVERRQQALTDTHNSVLERERVRRDARDERFRASRAWVMDTDDF